MIQIQAMIAALMILIFSTNTLGCELRKGMSAEQWSVVEYSYMRGFSHDMGYTLAAISIAESSAGLQRVNWADPSFGSYHILIKTAMKRRNITDPISQVELAYRLTYDDNLGANFALEELLYWKKRRNDSWMQIWSSYNAGNNWKNGLKYANKISSLVKKLRRCKLNG